MALCWTNLMNFQFSFFLDLLWRVLQASGGWVLLLRLQKRLQLCQWRLWLRNNCNATTTQRLRVIGACPYPEKSPYLSFEIISFLHHTSYRHTYISHMLRTPSFEVWVRGPLEEVIPQFLTYLQSQNEIELLDTLHGRILQPSCERCLPMCLQRWMWL